MHVSIAGPVCVWIDRLPGGRTPSTASLDRAERAAARRLRRPADRACFVAGRALRRRVLSAFTQEPPERLRFDGERLLGHDELSFSLARAWVAEADAHAIVLAVSRGVRVGAGVAADAAVAHLVEDEHALGPAAAWAGKDAVLRLAGGYAHPRDIRLDPVEVRGERRPDVELAWRPLPGACVAVAWTPRSRPALAPAA